MGSFFQFIFIFGFFGPCLLAALMPNWRFLAVYAALAGSVVLFLHIDTYLTSHEDPGVMGSIIIELFYLSIWPLAGAVAMRAVGLVLRARGAPRWAVIGASYSGVAVVCILYGLWGARIAWDNRGPSEACARSVFTVMAADQTYAIPAWPRYEVLIGGQNSGRRYPFSGRYLRRFCDIAEQATEAVPVDQFVIRFREIPTIDPQIGDPPCATTDADPWARHICDGTWPAAEAGYLEYAGLYRDGQTWGDSHCGHTDKNPHDQIQARVTQRRGIGAAMTPTQIDGFDYYDNFGEACESYWVARAPNPMLPDGATPSYLCHAAYGRHAVRMSDCYGGFPYREGWQLRYRFVAPTGAIATAVPRMERIVTDYLAELRAAAP